MERRSLAALAVLGICGMPVAIAGTAGRFSGIDNGWRVFFGGLHQDYREYNSGLNAALAAPIIDRERGVIPEMSLVLRRADARLYGDLTLRLGAGRDTYRGSACGANTCVPAASNTSNQILQTMFRLGPTLDGLRMRVVPFLALGTTTWYRTIESTPSASGTSERYAFAYYGGGVLIQRVFGSTLVWSLDALAARTIHPVLNVTNSEGALTMALGARPFWRVHTGLELAVGGGWWLASGVAYTRFAFGASPIYVTSQRPVQEPASRTEQWSLNLGFGRRF